MNRSSWQSFPELLTNRLLLRRLEPADAAGIYLLRSDPAVNQYIDRPVMQGPEDGLRFIHRINVSISEGDCLFWALVPKQQDDLIGTICIWNWNRSRHFAELGFELMLPWQQQGYMQEALSRVLEYTWDQLPLDKLEAWVHPGNDRSVRLLESNGFVPAPTNTAKKSEGTVNLRIFEIRRPSVG